MDVTRPPSALLTPSAPFGPASADELPTGIAGAYLYDPENEIDEVLRKTAPIFLIGRRGSGKTAFLRATSTSSQLAVELNSPELISQVGETIAAMRLWKSGEFAERIAPVWDACFTVSLCSQIWSRDCSLRFDDCAEAFRFGELNRESKDGRATDTATIFLHAVRKRLAGDPTFASVNTLLDEIELNGIPLWLARRSLEEAAHRRNWRATISMDSLDQYTGMLYNGGALATNQSFALQGLFRAASLTGRAPNPLYRVRVTFPAELWHFYSDLSANPLKDFDNSVLLHWDNRELLQVVGKRFLRYLELYEPQEYRDLVLAGSQKGRWTQALLHRYLPTHIVNGLGVREPTIPYLLRHTQLLPRHLITILNRVFGDQVRLRPGQITDQHIRSAVQEAEQTIVDSIISAYAIPYPNLQEICADLIPHLQFCFDASALHKQLNRLPKHGLDFSEILAMLIEVGAVGRMIEPEGPYHKVDFEYLHVNRLLITEEDQLCLHPLFAARFDSRSIKESRATPVKPILPLGSDPAGNDDFTRYVHMTQESRPKT